MEPTSTVWSNSMSEYTPRAAKAFRSIVVHVYEGDLGRWNLDNMEKRN